jgi:hypothetical protein
MRALTELPAGYVSTWQLDIPHARGLILGLNLLSIPLLLAFGWLYYLVLSPLIQPDSIFEFLALRPIWLATALFATYSLTVFLHEACHGLVFWIITRARPKFGFRWVYAYAAAPEFLIPRNPYLLVGLAPLVLISLAGFILVPLVSATIAGLTWFALTTNAAGAVGDLYVIGRLLRSHPAEALVRDDGERITVFQFVLQVT